MKIEKYVLLVISITLFVSCNDSNLIEPIENSGEVLSISGKLFNWNHGKDQKLLLVSDPGFWNNGDKIYSSSQIGEDGSFVFNSISNATNSSLLNHVYTQFVEEAKISNSSFYCSDSSAMLAYSRIIIVQNGDSTYKLKGNIYRKNFSDSFYFYEDSVKAGDFSSEYVYVNKDVSMTGTIKIDYYDKTYKKYWLSTYKYNIKYKKGWNRLVTYIAKQEVTKINDYMQIKTERYFINAEPSLARWDYTYYE
jgi:hypothetical protein